MMGGHDKATMRLDAESKRDPYSGRLELTITARPFAADDAPYDNPLRGLHIASTATVRDGETPSFSYWTLDYRDMYRIDLQDAERMVTTLRKIRGGLDKLERSLGYPASFAEYVLRVAAVLKIDSFYWFVDGERVWRDGAGARSWIDRQLAAFVAEHATVSA